MRVPLARNLAAGSLADAARLVVPVANLTSRRRIRKLAAAQTHEQRDRMLRRWSREALRALAVEVDASGLEHVGKGPYIVVALHEAMADVPVLIDQLPLPLTFVARNALDDELPTEGLLAASGQILIDPEARGSLQTMLRGAAQSVAQGRSIVTFAQGSVLGLETAFRFGAWVAARELELPMLPVAVWGTHRVWEHPFSPLVRRGQRVRMHVLEPRRSGSKSEYRELERRLKRIALSDEAVAPRRYLPERDGFWDQFAFEIDPDFPEVAEAVAQHRSQTSGM